jgi:hypothetical protein
MVCVSPRTSQVSVEHHVQQLQQRRCGCVTRQLLHRGQLPEVALEDVSAADERLRAATQMQRIVTVIAKVT